jgi:glucuronate isomerase
MSGFLGTDILLDTPEARRLYHEVAADLPIIDYHNHLDPQAILDDRQWTSIGEIWLEGDHYKWRAMRWNGIDEGRITGDASYREKFDAFAETVPHSIGNPLYHWTHLELKRYFGWDGVFGPETADEVWEMANARLAEKSHRARGLLDQMKVKFVGTTDDPCDSLSAHKALAEDPDLPFRVAPSFRPDPALDASAPGFGPYLDRLAATSGMTIDGFEDLVGALFRRLDTFVAAGCQASDHALNQILPFGSRSKVELDRILKDGREGRVPSVQEAADFKAALLGELGRAYAERDIVMQFHIGALRNQSSRLFDLLGRDVGGDSMSDAPIAGPLNALLDSIEQSGGLPRTVLYCLDPTRNEILVTTAGNFQDGSVPGKIQAGTAWWFNDQLDGMERQMVQLAQMGLLSHFLGMLTDSRSFLSFPRHEYFRRLLCRIVGRWVETGEVPDSRNLTDGLIRRVCYENAATWFLPDGT